ncbi:hypothetical protein LJR098_000825 [Rhizobium sp. LjRoot98]|uniref:hypothetical protein n=1 Tax=Rhizobium sp. LjRoot98 TaxID=3342345 RepID=UPI003ECFDE01
MMTAEHLYSKYPEVLYAGDLRDVPLGWLDIVDRYFQVVATIMEGTGYEVVTAKEYQGGLDWMWTSPVSAITSECHQVMDREDVLLELRSFHTCRVCGLPGFGWASGRTITTACEEHGVGKLIIARQPLVRRLSDGAVRYDEAADQLVNSEDV